jgi:nucleotide-binding universal stress UspA family protein
MHTLQSILLATDFRPASIDATNVAIELAAAFGARTRLLHVFQPSGSRTASWEDELALARWELDELAKHLTSKSVVIEDSELVQGHPADCIIRKGQEVDADLILIGAGKWTHGQAFAVGPIAEGILQHSRQSVFAVRPGEPAVKFKRILCPVDLSTTSERALRTTLTLAKVFEGAVHVVTVVPELGCLGTAGALGKWAGDVAEHKRYWKAEFEDFLANTDFDGIPNRHEVRHGVPHEEIVASAREHGADLVVMGSTGRSALTRFLMGSVARRVIQVLPCSLVSVRDLELADQLLEHDLEHIQLLLAQGHGLCDAGDYQNALLKFRHVLAYNPFDADALEAQAAVYERLGQRDRAASCRRRVKKTRPEEERPPLLCESAMAAGRL